MRPLLLLCAALTLSACGHPVGVLTPIAAVEETGAKRVDLLVVTTRSDAGIPAGEMFGAGRDPNTHYADIAVSVPPDSARQPGEVQWPSSLPPDPRKDFAALSAEKLDKSAALKRLDQRVAKAPHGRVLVFVHGYNTRFEEAVFRFAQIVHDSGAPAVPVLFTWPSRGQLLGYSYDRESANYSRDALETMLQELARNNNVREITILAHSMGNWATLEALRQMAIRTGGIHPKIRNVMLASPDVDIDVFHRQIATIGKKRPPFIVFVSRDDRALALSSRIWGSNPRLGGIDPNDEKYHSALVASGLQVVDLTNVKSADSLNHGKFAQNPEIVRLIGGRLAAGQTLTDSNSGLGDRIGILTTGAANAVGRAAAVTLSAPIAIIDPKTRRNLPNQIEELGEDAADTATNARELLPVR